MTMRIASQQGFFTCGGRVYTCMHELGVVSKPAAYFRISSAQQPTGKCFEGAMYFHVPREISQHREPVHLLQSISSTALTLSGSHICWFSCNRTTSELGLGGAT